jgi:uncharacterized Fe-S cluster protein YjdI
MTKKEIVRHYDKGGFSVVWQPAKCIHAEICVKTLPEVYRPDEKPWIRPEAASVDALKNQISKCPSGALTYEIKGEARGEDASRETVEVNVISGGPLMVRGSIQLTTSDGAVKLEHGTTAFCRCGASKNKPHCDGSHKTRHFE